MAVFRVEKNKDYTTISNYHLRDKRLSLKSKGLLSVMLSLPDDWDYSLDGLVSICLEKETSIKSSLKELKKYNYLYVRKYQNEKGKFEYEYNIYENPRKPAIDCPAVDIPAMEVPGLDCPAMENQGQLNTNNKILNNKVLNNKYNSLNDKIHFAEFVTMTNAEYEKLVSTYGREFTDQCISTLDNYKGSVGKKYKSDYRAILNWVVEKLKKDSEEKKGKNIDKREEINPNWLNREQSIKPVNATELRELEAILKDLGRDENEN